MIRILISSIMISLGFILIFWRGGDLILFGVLAGVIGVISGGFNLSRD